MPSEPGEFHPIDEAKGKQRPLVDESVSSTAYVSRITRRPRLATSAASLVDAKERLQREPPPPLPATEKVGRSADSNAQGPFGQRLRSRSSCTERIIRRNVSWVASRASRSTPRSVPACAPRAQNTGRRTPRQPHGLAARGHAAARGCRQQTRLAVTGCPCCEGKWSSGAVPIHKVRRVSTVDWSTNIRARENLVECASGTTPQGQRRGAAYRRSDIPPLSVGMSRSTMPLSARQADSHEHCSCTQDAVSRAADTPPTATTSPAFRQAVVDPARRTRGLNVRSHFCGHRGARVQHTTATFCNSGSAAQRRY